MVSGAGNVGELVGYYHSDGGEKGLTSIFTDYTVLGKITVNGNLLDGKYDFGGSNTVFTFTGREVYTPETESPEESTENP